MNYTLYLTEKCNLNCKYCFEKQKGEKELTFDDIKTIMDREVKFGSKSCVLTFFGGEPLLKKDLIFDIVNCASKLEKENKIKFKYSITTNGTLIDEKFLKLAKENDFLIGYSLDGNKETQNKNRINNNGDGTYDIVFENAQKLLKSVKKVVAMPVITKNNYTDMTQNVDHLFEIGFKAINCAFDYTANWQDEDLPILKNEYSKLADMYYERLKKGEKIYLQPFDNKISDYIKEQDCNKKCMLGLKHVNVSSSKKIYPCTQFVGREEYEIGNIETGIDKSKRENLIKKLQTVENNICKECEIKKRCKHTCGCLNILTTGDPKEVSPLTCETERMIIEISDKLADRLYKEKIPIFYAKEYMM